MTHNDLHSHRQICGTTISFLLPTVTIKAPIVAYVCTMRSPTQSGRSVKSGHTGNHYSEAVLYICTFKSMYILYICTCTYIRHNIFGVQII